MVHTAAVPAALRAQLAEGGREVVLVQVVVQDEPIVRPVLSLHDSGHLDLAGTPLVGPMGHTASRAKQSKASGKHP
jgi:hypothetical protein